MKNIYCRAIGIIILILSLTACAPPTFIKTSHANWNTIELRDSLEYKEAWKIVVDTIGQKFDLDVVNQDGGYLRTGWDYKWTGEINESYRVRALVKFAPDQRSLQVRSDAEYLSRNGWVMGEDERLTVTLKSDLMGKLGRITK